MAVSSDEEDETGWLAKKALRLLSANKTSNLELCRTIIYHSKRLWRGREWLYSGKVIHGVGVSQNHRPSKEVGYIGEVTKSSCAGRIFGVAQYCPFSVGFDGVVKSGSLSAREASKPFPPRHGRRRHHVRHA